VLRETAQGDAVGMVSITHATQIIVGGLIERDQVASR
jgi:hypothetical protein